MQVGTYQLAVMAKAMNKPVYAVAESFKFERLYPLNQKEVPNKHKVSCQMIKKGDFNIFLYNCSKQSTKHCEQ